MTNRRSRGSSDHRGTEVVDRTNPEHPATEPHLAAARVTPPPPRRGTGPSLTCRRGLTGPCHRAGEPPGSSQVEATTNISSPNGRPVVPRPSLVEYIAYISYLTGNLQEALLRAFLAQSHMLHSSASTMKICSCHGSITLALFSPATTARARAAWPYTCTHAKHRIERADRAERERE